MIKEYLKPILSLIIYMLNDLKKRIPLNKKNKLNNFENKILNKLNKDGYAVIENFFSFNDCLDIIEKIDNTINRYPDKIWKDHNNSDNRIFGAEFVDHKIMNYFSNKLIHKIGETFCGCQIKNLMTMANRTKYLKMNCGSGGGWHRDAYRKKFKSILYLQKVNKSIGPFQLIKKSNRFINFIKIIIKLKKSYPDTRFKDEEIKTIFPEHFVKTLEGDVGTLILFDPSLIHRGAPLEEAATRYALTNYYETLHSSDDILDHYKPRFK